MENETGMTTPYPAIDDLDTERLRTLRSRIDTLLAEREAQAKRAAIARIRALARDAGLGVSIGPAPKKRGRPRKGETAAP